MKYFFCFCIITSLLCIAQLGMAQDDPNFTLNVFPDKPPGPGNPYLKGQRGNWRLKRTNAYLVNRSATRTSDSPNPRKDGLYESFETFWNPPVTGSSSKDWQTAPVKWTVVKENIKFSPHGQELEEQDALKIFSTVQYGYNGFLIVLAAANSRYQEVGFDGFEDYDFILCDDDHFNFTGTGSPITKDESHTGRKSIKIAPGEKASMTRRVNICLPPEVPSDNTQVVPK